MIAIARLVHRASMALALVALGCSPKEQDQGQDQDDTDDDTDGHDDDIDDTDDDDGHDDTTTGDAPGQGVAVRDVTLFQTIGVPIVADGAVIAPAERVAPIVAGRVAMVRTAIALETNVADLIARVDLQSAGGSESLAGACTAVGAGAATAELRVEIPAASIAADTQWSLSIETCDGTVLATTTAAELGAETTGILRLHVVPFEVGGFVPDTSQPVLDGFRDALLAHYPVTDVVITVGAVEPDDNAGVVDMDALLLRIVQLQEADVFGSGDFDPAKADIYWFGLVTGAPTRDEFCDECPTGTSEAGVGERAGSSLGAAFGDELSESTLVHEMGHLHGLLHSPCGDPSLQDPDFPYVDGTTHTEGWDMRTGELVPPTHNDLMGYCQPRWVSDYQYRKLVDWVQLAATWDD